MEEQIKKTAVTVKKHMKRAGIFFAVWIVLVLILALSLPADVSTFWVGIITVILLIPTFIFIFIGQFNLFKLIFLRSKRSALKTK